MRSKINWDALGISASVICAIHCAILPLFMASLPLFGINIIENVAFELGMILLAFLIGIYALHHGYKYHHHNKWPILLFATGILFLVLKQVFLQYHTLLLVPAVVLIITAHLVNYRYCRSHNHAHADDCDHDHY
ncbi:MerC domain-containing protein [Niabella aurantiaca]|uniref:MerC domain-containing protein n=1 Tax=Niabella aurantiaca TaxID=379900 RepID=UPI00047591AD|nr:MerC domain-containing protein [Niabella aurantiaca]